MRIRIAPDRKRLEDVASIGGQKDELREAMREMKRRNRVGRQLVDVVRVQHHIDENGEELEQHQTEMYAGVDLAHQHRAAAEAEHEMTEQSHQPDVGLQIGDKAGMFGGLHLHLYICNGKTAQLIRSNRICMNLRIAFKVIAMSPITLNQMLWPRTRVELATKDGIPACLTLCRATLKTLILIARRPPTD